MTAEPEIGVALLTDRLKTHALSLGHFSAVLGHEPKNAPADMTGAFWYRRVQPSVMSNLASAAALLRGTFRCYAMALAEDGDDIEIRVNNALDAMVSSMSADFTLGGAVVAVDALGIHGEPLAWDLGYVTVGQTLYRVGDLSWTLICHDTWTHTE